MIINNSKVKKQIIENQKEKDKIKKALKAFVFGFLIAILAQLMYDFFLNIFSITLNESSILTSMSAIFISFLLTGIGKFDNFANVALSGAVIPITGFANSITSSALEGKSEGLIFGIGSKIFSLIGSVCTYGIVSSIILGFIYYFFMVAIYA